MMEDKRITYANICGKEFPLCLTVAAHQKIIDTYGGLAEMAKAIGSGEAAISNVVPVARILMEGGVGRLKALAWMDGEETPKIIIPEENTLREVLDIQDIRTLTNAVMVAIATSRKVTVEVDHEEENNTKNADATQE